MAGPGGWSTARINFANENRLQFMRGSNGRLEQPQFMGISQEDKIRRIAASQNYQVLVLESVGSKPAGFNAPEDFVLTVANTWKIPNSFLRCVCGPGSLSRFDYLVEPGCSSTPNDQVSAINIGCRWGLGHSNYVLVFGRLDIVKSTLRLFVASRAVHDFGSEKGDQTILRSIDLNDFWEESWEQPMHIFGMILQRCERYLDLVSQETNYEVLRLGKSIDSLYSPWMTQWSNSRNIQPDADSDEKSGKLFECYNDVAWNAKCCDELLDICRRYQSLGDMLEWNHGLGPSRHLVDRVTHRVGMHSHFFSYLDRMVSTQFTYRYNYFAKKDVEANIEISRASKNISETMLQDSSSMKTVAYLTLAFLPATFVCALFSTTMFNFQKFRANSRSNRVVSPAWWIFVLCCVASTLMTLAIWSLLLFKRKRGARRLPEAR